MRPKLALAISTSFNALFVFCIVIMALIMPKSGAEKALTLAEAKARDTSADFDLIHDLFAYSSDYIGKSVTLTGFYSNSHMDESGEISEDLTSNTLYHFLTVFDAPGDCHYTIEFVPDESFVCKAGSAICVTGEFSQYTEEDQTYFTLKDTSVQLITEPKQELQTVEVSTSAAEVTVTSDNE